MLDMAMNTMIFVDLYLTLIDPFQSRSTRMKYYYLVGLTTIVGTLLIIVYYSMRTADEALLPENFLFVYMNIIFVLASFMSFSLVLIRLCMKGTSKELRTRILKSHVSYFVIFMYTAVGNVAVQRRGAGRDKFLGMS